MPVLIRSTAKAIILHEGRILLNRCADSRNQYCWRPMERPCRWCFETVMWQYRRETR